MWEVLHVELPFSEQNGLQVLFQVHNLAVRPRITLAPPLANHEQLIERLWHQQPEQRPTMDEAMRILETLHETEVLEGQA